MKLLVSAIIHKTWNGSIKKHTDTEQGTTIHCFTYLSSKSNFKTFIN